MRKNILTIFLIVLVCLNSYNAQAVHKRVVIGGIGLGIGVAGLAASATVLGLFLQDQYVNGYYCSDGILSSNAQAQCCDVAYPYVSNCVAQNPSQKPPCGTQTAVCPKSNGGYEYASPTYTDVSRTAQIASGVSLGVSVLVGAISAGILIYHACNPQPVGDFGALQECPPQ